MAQTSERGFASHSAFMKFSPPKRSSALTTPMRAPPAMNPLAMRVPFSPRSLASSLLSPLSSLLSLVTYQLTAPPTSRGILSSKGMNIPSAKGSAGTFMRVRITAIAAPIA